MSRTLARACLQISILTKKGQAKYATARNLVSDWALSPPSPMRVNNSLDNEWLW